MVQVVDKVPDKAHDKTWVAGEARFVHPPFVRIHSPNKYRILPWILL